jgi:hypothetical protein
MPAASLDFGDKALRFNNTFIQVAGFDFNVAGYLRVWTEIEIREVKADSIYFDPYRAGFRLGADILYRGFILKVFHECDHDIITGDFLNPYNGLDMAFNCYYAGWSAEFSVTPHVLIKPAFFMGLRFDAYYINKENNRDHYFGDSPAVIPINYHLYPRLQAEADFHDLVKLSVAFQPEYSITRGMWSRIRIDTGIELHYGNIAAGIGGKNQIRLDSTGWAFNELRLYIAFKGKSPLL